MSASASLESIRFSRSFAAAISASSRSSFSRATCSRDSAARRASSRAARSALSRFTSASKLCSSRERKRVARSMTVDGMPKREATARALGLPGTPSARRKVGVMVAESKPTLAFSKRSSASASAFSPS